MTTQATVGALDAFWHDIAFFPEELIILAEYLEDSDPKSDLTFAVRWMVHHGKMPERQMHENVVTNWARSLGDWAWFRDDWSHQTAECARLDRVLFFDRVSGYYNGPTLENAVLWLSAGLSHLRKVLG